MRILITGGAGFIGSHLTELAVRQGHEVTVLDSLITGRREWLPKGAELLEGDLCKRGLPSLMAAVKPDAIVHLAAYADVRSNWHSLEQRDRLFAANVHGTRMLLEAMPRVPIVFASTAAVYGSARGHVGAAERPFDEDDAFPWSIESPYAASKWACEAMIVAYAKRHGFPWHIARMTNVLGARSEHGVIADFVRMMREKGAIHAADDGLQRKSCIAVTDVADALLKMLRPAWLPSGIFNLSSRQDFSWWDVMDAMRLDPTAVTCEKRAGGAIGDPVGLHVSVEKLGKYESWDRSIHDAIHEALDWHGWTPATAKGAA